MGRKATVTTLQSAGKQNGSLRTTLPKWIVDHFGLSAGSSINWSFMVQNGEVAVVMTPIEGEEHVSAS
tara:strand:+ start:184 stop:387 length:204 start_codon:yes stop_codon:yes gene_type:complete